MLTWENAYGWMFCEYAEWGGKPMVEVKLHERTQALLIDPSLGDEDIDSKIRALLRTEFLQQLARHRRTDKLFTDKYGMSFEEFIQRRVTKEENFSWDVEQDAMALGDQLLADY